MIIHHKKRYDNFIESLKRDRDLDTFEIHHIVPKSMGGDDNKNNLIKLTPREHFIAHLMLHKTYPESISMLKALQAMFRSNFFVHGKKFNGRKYEVMRRYAFRKTAKPPKDLLHEEYYVKRKSLAQISRNFGVSEPTVKKWYVNSFENFKAVDNREKIIPSRDELVASLSDDIYPFLKTQRRYDIKLSLLQKWRGKYNLRGKPGKYKRGV